MDTTGPGPGHLKRVMPVTRVVEDPVRHDHAPDLARSRHRPHRLLRHAGPDGPGPARPGGASAARWARAADAGRSRRRPAVAPAPRPRRRADAEAHRAARAGHRTA